jgi:hypothetical protein
LLNLKLEVILSKRVILEDLIFSQIVKKFSSFFVTINAFGESSIVKKLDFMFRHPNTKHKGQTKEGTSDKRRQTDVKYVIFLQLASLSCFLYSGRNIE